MREVVTSKMIDEWSKRSVQRSLPQNQLSLFLLFNSIFRGKVMIDIKIESHNQVPA